MTSRRIDWTRLAALLIGAVFCLVFWRGLVCVVGAAVTGG